MLATARPSCTCMQLLLYCFYNYIFTLGGVAGTLHVLLHDATAEIGISHQISQSASSNFYIW